MNNKRLVPTLLAVALMATGCSFIPTMGKTDLPVADQYPIATAATDAPAADIPWKSFYTDARLQQIIDLALENNRDLRVAVLNIDKARAAYDIQGAALYPEVGVSASATRAPSQLTGKYTNSYNVGLATANWEIDFWGRIRSLKDQALAQYLSTEEGRKSTQITLIAAVANTWLGLQADEELLEISRSTLQTREESIKLAKLRFDAGAASELDFRQAQTLTETARATLAAQTRQRDLDINALTLLVGGQVPPDLLTSLKGKKLTDLPALADVPAGLPSDLLLRRPDIRSAEQQMVAANANIGAARALFFPNISLTASAGFANNEISDLFQSGSKYFSIGPSLYLPIFTAGRNQANLEVAEVSKKIAAAQYEKSIQTAFREVSDSLVSRRTLVDQLKAQQAQVDAVSAQFKLSDLRYRNGVSSYLDLLDAQRTLFTAEQAVVQVRLALIQNQVSLYKVLGGGWSPEDDRATARSASATGKEADKTVQ
ncbi:efflux transporter outer membrane subunit [Diaphorobacter sp. HDW4A]|uniref:efflux transporter outer membrane subunit n=1 Tax=Diaphorobacter sp. HDW4A TaxID=2714924 RepID=UPI0014081CDC|nr:efflux transporter outer membrane subunit [Diaphorobacter sp. HDW4A]QIL82170.1 efflux transporter outer membrane subunit [Diaphorobacter sp. HDW4A]